MDIFMVHIFLMIFALLNCITPIYGSEVDKKLIIFTVKVALASDSLKYCDKKYIDLIKKEYGVVCNDNDPFVAVSEYRSTDDRTETIEYRKNALKTLEEMFEPTIFNQRIASLTQDSKYLGISEISQKLKQVILLPFNLFYVSDGNRLTFKKEDSVLFSFKKHIESIEYEFEIRSKTDFDGGNPQDCLNRFKKLPLCMIGGFNGGDQKPGFIDTKSLEEELLKAGIIEKEDGKFIHGPKGYFKKELPEEPVIKESPLSVFSLKNFLFCFAGLTGLAIISVIYLRSINPC
jgi:hypothetical protein